MSTIVKTDERCHWSPEHNRRVTRRHLRDCIASGCEGCDPCRKDHCAMPRCSHHLREDERRVCASCIGEVRTSLVRIVQLCGFAPAVAATATTIDSAAAALAGPVAEHTTWAARHAWVVHHRGLCRCTNCPDLWPEPSGPSCEEGEKCDHYVCRRRSYRPTCPYLLAWLDTADDEHHPLWVLESWDRLVAEHLGHQRTLRVTVQSAADYLGANLTDLARMEDFAFDELGRELAECVVHAEGVLLLRARVQRGAPCPVCGKADLEKVFEATDAEVYDQANDAYLDASGHWEDLWVCPNAQCHQTWTEQEYRAKVQGIYVQAADKLTAAQIASTYRVPEGTVRRWAKEGKVRRRGYDGQRRQLYDVGDVRACRDGVA